MNDFTKEELELIKDCINYSVGNPYGPTADSVHVIFNKIQSMIKSCLCCEKYESHLDRDRTPMQCDCYSRGQDDKFKIMISEINDILDGKDDGLGLNCEPWGALRRRLLSLVNK